MKDLASNIIFFKNQTTMNTPSVATIKAKAEMLFEMIHSGNGQLLNANLRSWKGILGLNKRQRSPRVFD